MKHIRILPALLFLSVLIVYGDDQATLSRQPTAERKVALVHESRFDSVDEFVAEMKTFSPAASDDYLGWQFAAVEVGQPEAETTGKVSRATKLQDCSVIWKNDVDAIVLATARPPTDATPEIGVLFLLERMETKWRIADLKRFSASGHYAGVDVKLTSYVGTGYTLEPDDIVVTVTENQGGRGMSHRISASFRLFHSSLSRVDLE